MTNQTDTVQTQRSEADSIGRIGVYGLIFHVLEWKRFIVYFVIACTFVSIVISFLLPKWYKSAVSLLPPKNQALSAGISGISALLKEVAPGAAGKLGGQSSTYSFLAILESRRAQEAMVRRFNLIQEYDISDGSMEKAIKEFASNYNIEVTEQGSVVIEIVDKDSVRAAEMANYMAQLLNEISVEIGTGEARSNRLFLEKRVDENKAALRAAEDTLRRFQEKHGMVLLPEDAKSVASSIGSLYARKVRSEIELELLRKTVGSENPAYQQLQLENYELKKKLSTFPNLGMESFRLYRDMIIQQKILEFLVPLYEQTRFEEQKDIPVMVVLDKAVPAEKKFRPKRLFIILSSFVSSLMLSSLLVLFITKWRMFKFDNAQRFERLKGLLRWKTSIG